MRSVLTKFINIRSPDLDECQPMDARKVNFISTILAKKCKKCNSVKPPMSHHCSICGRCIARMDHHCPWVNNCVGYYNQKHFLLFLIYVFVGSFHALVLIIINACYCLDKNCYLFNSTGIFVLTILSAFCALLFGLFVVVMFVDQLQCIIGNTSTIDSL
jgi:hypothetical protein